MIKGSVTPSGESPDFERTFTLGALGLLNGIFGVFDEGKKKGYGTIFAEMDGSGKITRFGLIEP